jgi:hypothetical protein
MKTVQIFGRTVRAPWLKLTCFLIYGAIVLVAYRFSFPCVWRYLFGVSCPGCGLTRAWLSALSGNLSGAFDYHPMFWSIPLIAAYIIFDGRLFRCRQIDEAVLILLGAGFAVHWITALI